jgi:hypothetical protein
MFAAENEDEKTVGRIALNSTKSGWACCREGPILNPAV